MATHRVWTYASAVLLATVCSIFADQTVNPIVGVLFLHVLERGHYQEGFRSFQVTYGIITNTPITFSTNLDDHPDRPRWLRFTQRTAYHDGMLYGTPTSEDIGQRIIEVQQLKQTKQTVFWKCSGDKDTTTACIRCESCSKIVSTDTYNGGSFFYLVHKSVSIFDGNLESSKIDLKADIKSTLKYKDQVTAYNRKTYETTSQNIIINVEQTLGLKFPYQVEFFVKNRNVEEVLPFEVQKQFKDRVQSIWESNHLTIINITSALDRGGRVPLPIEGRKEGVYVKVGSRIPFPSCLEEEASPDEQCDDQQEPISCEDAFSPHFIIDWCNILLMDKSKPDIPDPDLVPGDGVLTDGGEYSPPSNSLEDRDYYLDYVVTITVPLVIALILCLILTYIMCCRREGIAKRDAKTSDIQLVHHHSIQDNACELRDLAKSRDGIRPLSTLPMFNARTGERAPPRLLFNYDTSRVPLVLDQQEPHSDPSPRNQPKTQQQKTVFHYTPADGGQVLGNQKLSYLAQTSWSQSGSCSHNIYGYTYNLVTGTLQDIDGGGFSNGTVVQCK